MAKVRLSPRALRDLESIWRHPRLQWGVKQADFYVDLLNAAFDNVAQTPLTAAACDHIRAGYRRRVVERHMVYFKVVDDGIVVIRVMHDRMDAGRYL